MCAHSITVSANDTQFHLRTAHASYIFRILPNGAIENLHVGGPLHLRDTYPDLETHEIRKVTPVWSFDGHDICPEMLRQEYPASEHGDFRTPAYEIEQADGSRITEFRYQGCDIVGRKDRLQAMPSSFDDDHDGAETLILHFVDETIDCALDLHYTVFPHQDVIVRSARFANHGTSAVTLTQAASLALDLPDADYDLIQFSGAWARENHLTRARLQPGIHDIASIRGASSHQHNPFFLLARPHATEASGVVLGFHLIYSGDYRDRIEVDHYDTTRVVTGLHPDRFSWRLEPGESFQTPEAVLCIADDGFDGLSTRLSDFITRHVVNPRFARAPRPVLINNWEATYFDFDQSKLLSIARQAKNLGIELFVLDDGWFGHRDDSTTSLGDWWSDRTKLPDGVEGVSRAVHDLGLEFGLWFEPEMVSADSELHAAHPEWLIGHPSRALTTQRNQYVLDMARPEVVDYLYERISRVIADTQLDYVKWDMNRSLTEEYSRVLPPERQRELPHRYILGVYDLYARLTAAFPNVLFESCASGGGRFDLGMMYYAPQAWTSDDTDAVERMSIQYATSFGYPLSTMGAHVSAVPNHETGRITPLATRGAVAYFGDLGYELDITRLDDAQLEEISRQIAFYTAHRSLFQQGRLHRLVSPYEGDGGVMAWQVVSPDLGTSIVAHFTRLNRPNPPVIRLRLRGLDPDRLYTIRGKEAQYYGDELMNAGLHIPPAFDPIQRRGGSDFSTQLFVIEESPAG